MNRMPTRAHIDHGARLASGQVRRCDWEREGARERARERERERESCIFNTETEHLCTHASARPSRVSVLYTQGIHRHTVSGTDA